MLAASHWSMRVSSLQIVAFAPHPAGATDRDSVDIVQHVQLSKFLGFKEAFEWWSPSALPLASGKHGIGGSFCDVTRALKLGAT